ncbi:MAG: hydantoinase B/oxoprolinase family protein [Gammaproteobacteria bacterium]|jgi:N-methylhydantoinase B|nr:hydantoinase B/oxoprolinase family protein [Gammaproteobacteria bacterium]MBT4379336.1 hydantoinase B/oxoprolinase family protein [Gammaproteobacteria bacterium]MBT4617868.1 hydantoinase B/oxoprolinase family protein [Gammaproteobacteria bacterium]MBT5198184.1 hydantoinase B/oxoprolinase family protein [Gammaproteobacteria bacterium]MBT5441365.1 hydantoinase B/oxoprolinase family protein [Gammaproteobacteria bacterium]
MPAKIIETNSAPFQSIDVDTVTVDIIENALRNVREEMDAVLFRTAMSPGIREQGDCFPMVANRDGKMVVGQFGSFIHGFMEAYDGEIEEGDIILTNDPYMCNAAVSHLPDWIVLVPIFKDGRHLAWAAMFGHMSDNGGMVPGSIPISAETIYQEGIRIPPTKLYKKGVLQSEVLELILHNVRTSEWNRFDLNALVAACRTASKRCVEIAERFGDDTFCTTMQMMLDRNLEAMRSIINIVVPEEPQYFEDFICDDGVGKGPYKIACTWWREGDVAVFDFEGTDPQAKSSVNFYLNEDMFKMFFGSFTINLFDPHILFNDGFYELVDVRIPEGSLLKPKFPAALSGRTHALGRIFDVMGGLLGQASPDALNAAGFSDSPHLFFSGYDKQGKWFQLFQIGFGGIPGRPIGDGPDGHSLWPGFTNVPNEFIEAYFPLRIMKYEPIPDSGGAGLHRGGNGLTVAYEFLVDGQIGIHDDRWLTYPWGVQGGDPGMRSSKLLVRASGDEEWLPAKCDEVDVKEGDVLYFNTWGGGGWGDPTARDPAVVKIDVDRGLVSREGARRYGVVLGDDGSVDTDATDALRNELRLQHTDDGLFNYGGTIEELKARSLEETHLEAPVAPTF